MAFIKKGNVRIPRSKKKHHIPSRLKTSKKSPFVGTCPVFGKETNAKQEEEYPKDWKHCTVHISPTWDEVHGVDNDGKYIFVNELRERLRQIPELKERNKKLIDVLETGIICMERNWFEEIPVYIKNYLNIAKAAITSSTE